ncbi:Amino acid/polyamine transporter I [Cordyceps fumosorosea ARSEF 2679]|uniref:Amino acid/polyamine transporter I n=1 Tax=Cordyceps fumosorosea (strain ARSEF 2679) TaxID=1081104 RepID=A0A168ANG3_CORFA|nr:Amino acid/polyamine transporter I [Cordyceps fumosorosea ARSEF 2679]OAA68976.1 Amino acid/polyamine transporter I [Cordyceps fumosorosea ARSEF 2679]
MPSTIRDPDKAKSPFGPNVITMTRDFEVLEMSDLTESGLRRTGTGGLFSATTSFAVVTGPSTDGDDDGPVKGNLIKRVFDSFRPAPRSTRRYKGYSLHQDVPPGERRYDVREANARTVSTGLSRELKGRHLQMIAIGGSIGMSCWSSLSRHLVLWRTGLFVASGIALFQSGPASMILAYFLVGVVQFCIMQALCELAVAFPVAGSFSVFSTRFLDPSWGFAMGWNYAILWLFSLPLEIIAGALTVQYWNDQLSQSLFVTIFLVVIGIINLIGIKGYGEAEFLFSTVKVTAIVGFILLGIVINIGGPPDSGYIGGRFWLDPGPTRNGFKGFCSVLVTSSLSFIGTELVGLAAAEAANPRKALPGAIRQVFWRIAIFYLVSLLLVSLLVPYDDPRLLSASDINVSRSPFVLAVEAVGTTVLPSVMNGVILLAVLSVGNSAVFGSSRVLAALAEQSHAPRIFSYVDRGGRPLVAILFALSLGLLAYLIEVHVQARIFDWLLSICGLSSLFTWISICLSHVRFRSAWAAAGNTLDQLPYRSQAGVIGSWFAITANVLVLAAQFWLAVSPLLPPTVRPLTTSQTTHNFFRKILTIPVVFGFYAAHKLWFKTKIITLHEMDLDTGRSFSRRQVMTANSEDSSSQWPLWKKVYKSLC